MTVAAAKVNLLPAALAALTFAVLWRHAVPPSLKANLADSLNGVGRTARAFLATLLVAGVILGGGKTRLLLPPLPPTSLQQPAFTESERSAGFACVAGEAAPWMPTNAAVLADFASATNAAAHRPWLATGVHDDYFALTPPANAPVRLGTNGVRRLVVFSQGAVRAILDDGSHALLEPCRVPLSFLPESAWAAHGVTSRCWTASSPASTVVAWENALYARDPARPLSFQVEFLRNGDFLYRYGGEDAVTNAAAAAFSRGGAIVTGAVARASALLFRCVEGLGDGTGDADGDGLPDYGEVLLHGTDPFHRDSDGDGLDDGVEITRGLDPLSPDTDGDGAPDGWNPGYLEGGGSPLGEGGFLTVSLDEDLPPGTYAVLAVNGVPVILRKAATFGIRCDVGGWATFRLSGNSRSGVAAPLSLHVDESCEAFRVENEDGLFTSVFRGTGEIEGAGAQGCATAVAGGAAREAAVLVPVLRLASEGDVGTVIHCVPDVDSVAFTLECEPAGCDGVGDYIESQGFREGSRYVLDVPDGRGEESDVSASLWLRDGWLTYGSFEAGVSVHRTEIVLACPVCGMPEPDCVCELWPDCVDDGEAPTVAWNFLRVGETNAVGGTMPVRYCDYCGGLLTTQILCNVVSKSGGVGTFRDPGSESIGVVANSASGALWADYVRYRLGGEGSPWGGERRQRFTCADIRLRLDYDGDGVVSKAEKDRAASAQAGAAPAVWAIPHRAEPYRVDFTVLACTDLVVRASVRDSGGRLFADRSCATNVTGRAEAALERGGTTTLWLSTTNQNVRVDLSLSLGLPGRTQPELLETIPLAVRSMDLPERWTTPAGATLHYAYPAIGDAPAWCLVSCADSNAVQTAVGNFFAVPPSPLAAGNYWVTALDPDLVREGFAHNMATGMLHVVETRLATNGITIVRTAVAGSASGRQLLALAPGSTQTANWEIDSGAGGARLYAAATGGEPQTAVTNATEVWVAAGGECGDYTVTATHPNCPASHDSATVSVVGASLVPDYDFDGLIDAADEAHLATNRTFTMWLNNDNDDASGFNNHDGSEGGSGYEVPDCGYLYADWSDTKVNGLRDLIDWFPVCLDLSQLMDAFPVGGGYSYRFAQADNALSFVWTALGPDQAGSYLFGDIACAGQNFAHPVTNATVARMSGGRVAIPAEFLAQTGHDLVCLVEGRYASSTPLALEVVQGESLIARIEMPLRVSTVEDMFRFSNLRPPLGGSSSPQSRIGEPPCRPYIPNGKTVFLVHGFRVGANESRGWGSEFFKKLLRSGSRADFWMVTWESDASPTLDPLGIDYYMNVVNAFATAPHLANLVNSVQGDKIILAHSLGNMVVSSAIQDHSMQVDKYFALNSAVASEAYNATLADISTNSPLTHVDWDEFEPRAWSACWHSLFLPNDDRARLTWGNRFSSVVPFIYNFYSSGDEVLEMGGRGIDAITFDGDVRQYTWQKQELFKGRNVLYGSGWAGWGFESNVTAQAANTASPETLRDFPIFEHDPDEMFSATITTNMQNRILAKGIPALSKPTGALTLSALRDYDMNYHKANGWCRCDEYYEKRWLHTDIHSVAFFFTHNVFKEFVVRGDLDEN